MDLPELEQRLTEFARAQTGCAVARIVGLYVLGGHAGFGWGFNLLHQRDGREEHEPLVIRLPPPGVRWTGTADVLRQARALAALGEAAVPHAPVVWSGDDLRWFGCPYLVSRRMPGDVLRLWPGEEPTGIDAATFRRMARQSAEALAALHRVDWQRTLADWGPPPPLSEEVTRWDWLLERTSDPARTSDPSLTAAAPRVRDRLLARTPDTCRTGLYHGDYQWSNLLFDHGWLAAVLDWELTGVGATLMDLGWLATFSDPACWSADTSWTVPLPGPEEVVSLYEEAAGEHAIAIDWYRALAAYKFALITGLNLTLHRRGRRPDPHWELIAPSAPLLLERALALLG